jgi:hypothetical protein
MPLIKATHTDRQFSFDFGKLPAGRYTLILDDEGRGSSDWFDSKSAFCPGKTHP